MCKLQSAGVVMWSLDGAGRKGGGGDGRMEEEQGEEPEEDSAIHDLLVWHY